MTSSVEFEELRVKTKQIATEAWEELQMMSNVEGAEIIIRVVVGRERRKKTAQEALAALRNPSSNIETFRHQVLAAKKAMEKLDARAGHTRISGDAIQRYHGQIAALEDEVFELYQEHQDKSQ